MKTLEELRNRLWNFKDGKATFPSFDELAELAGIEENKGGLSVSAKLNYLFDLVGKNRMSEFENNYISNTFGSVLYGGQDSLNKRQIDFINYAYSKYQKSFLDQKTIDGRLK